MIDFISNIPLEKIGWTALHFFWISALFLGIIAFMLKHLEKPLLRYRIAQGSLLVLLLLPVALWIEKPEPVSYANQPKEEVSRTTSNLSQNTIAKTVDKNKDLSSPKRDQTGYELNENKGEMAVGSSFLSGLATIDFSPLYSWIGGIWTAGCLLMLLYLIGGVGLIIRKNYRYGPLTNPRWGKTCRQLSQKLGVSHHIQLLSSDQITTPCVVGFLRPSVWIPARLAEQLDASQIKALLTHELVHIKRKDYLAGLIQQGALTILFMQPMVWWLIKKMQQEREFICDIESAALHQNTYHYASTLLQIKKNCSGRLNTALAGINATEHQLVKRIRRLTSISDEDSTKKMSPRISYGLVLVLLLSVFGMGWTSYQLNFKSESGFAIELDRRIPNPFNGGGMAVIFPWNQMPEDARQGTILPNLDPKDQKSFAKIKFTGNPESKTSDELYVLFVNPTSTPQVYVDKNQNLNFTDDGGRHIFSGKELTVEIPQNGVDNARHMIRWTVMQQSTIEALKERPDHWTNQYSYITIFKNERLNHSTGHWKYNGRTYSLTLIDKNLNGVFGETDTGFIAVNHAKQESLENRESYFLSEQPTLSVESTRFKVVNINPDGSAVRLKKAE